MSREELEAIKGRLATVGLEGGAWLYDPNADEVRVSERVDLVCSEAWPFGPFIAHAPADIAALLAEVETLRNALGECVREYETAHRMLADLGVTTHGANHKNRERWDALSRGRQPD